MTNEEKQLLLKDLCGRLPYKTKVYFSIIYNDEPVELSLTILRCFERIPLGQNDIVIKPYLRPMSSMTEDEKKKYLELLDNTQVSVAVYVPDEEPMVELVDWLNENKFDYRCLIPMGLALEALEGMYKTE